MAKLQYDPVAVFFQEMRRYPLLTPLEEQELAHQVVAAQRIINAREKHANLSDVELATYLGIDEMELHRRLKLGARAKKRMIESNLRLVISIAKQYVNRGVEFLDLIQEGAIGLSRAVEGFDPTKGFRFSTYAYGWIRLAVTRSIANNGRTIRLPVHITEALNKLQTKQRELRKELNRTPTEAELATAMNLSVQKLSELIAYKQRRTLSLNAPCGKDAYTELIDLLDLKQDVPEQSFSFAVVSDRIEGVASEELSKREWFVLRQLYGLDDGSPRTPLETGQLMGIGPERVRQIGKKAIRRMRNAYNRNLLKELL